MKLSVTFWLALLAVVLALGSVAVRLARRNVEEFSDVIAPIAMAVLMFGILAREWSQARKGR